MQASIGCIFPVPEPALFPAKPFPIPVPHLSKPDRIVGWPEAGATGWAVGTGLGCKEPDLPTTGFVLLTSDTSDPALAPALT
jgi:hypothetical protein